VDNTVWTDLVERGFARERTVWFYKLDLDPAVRIPWQRFDYVVSTNMLVGNLDRLPRSREVYANSAPVVRYAQGDEVVEIRRLDPPVGRSVTAGPPPSGTRTTPDAGTSRG
jgi:hypothetical protein